MSTEQQFLKWLRREGKTFCENLQFAIKAWTSSEFTLISKYDTILNWAAETGSSLPKEGFPIKEYTEILQLRAQPALINLESKRKYIQTLLIQADEIEATKTRLFPELLRKVLTLEWMQDLLRSDNEFTTRVYGRLLELYESYLNKNSDANQVLLTAHETDFLTSVLNSLKDHVKNSGELVDWMNAYDAHIVQPLTQVTLLLRSKYGIDFFDELRGLEETLRKMSPKPEGNLLSLPFHSAMLTLECLIANQRTDDNLFQQVFGYVFPENAPEETNISPKILLLRGAYILDILRKHNVLLTFKIEEATAMNYLGARIHECARKYKESNLREVLLLLCAALRLNPLILDQHVFELTTWMIVAKKPTEIDDQTTLIFENYLSLLLDMFRRLSRAEKFVVHLLKALKEWLDKHELEPLNVSPKKLLKRKLKQVHAVANKQTKVDDGDGVFIHISNDDYIDMLFHDFRKQLNSVQQHKSPRSLQNSFVFLQQAWPSSTIGFAFSTLITGLVSKAQLTIWKTLLFALKEQLAILNNVSTYTENAYFRLDFHAALLCQLLAGARLTEQYEKYASDIIQLRKLTKEVLSLFGELILSRPYHKRTMSTFLECAYYIANLELLLAYYRPDGLEDESLKADNIIPNLHAFMNTKQWSEIEQRVENCGKSSCHTLFERLQLQRAESEKLLSTRASNVFKGDTVKLVQLINASEHGSWIIAQLSRAEMIKLIKYKMQDIANLGAHRFLLHISEHAEALELLSYAVFEYICKEFSTNCKSTLLASLEFDFETIYQRDMLEHQVFDKTIKATVNVIVQSTLNYKVKKLPIECVNQVLELFKCLPLGHLRRQTKSLLFCFYVAFYQDLKIAQAVTEANQLFDCLTDLLHFGQQVPIFRYFEMTKILELLPIADCWEFYKFLFSTIKNEEKGTDEFLKSLEVLLSSSLSTNKTLSSDERRLLLIAVETLSALSGQIGRRIQKHLHALLRVYGDYIYTHFEQETSTKKDKKFVEKTLAGFPAFTKAVLLAAAKATNEKQKNETDDVKEKEINEKSLKPLDEKFRRICKIYIGHSMNYRNPHAIQLTQVALKNRKLLHLDLDEIELVLSNYWRQLNSDLYQTTESEKEDSFIAEETQTPGTMAKTSDTLVKMIIENKTNEDLLLTLKDIGANMSDETSFMNVTDLLTLVAKSNFSTIKGAIFNEQFKQIMGSILLRLTKNEQHKFTNEALVLKILNCQQACVENRGIPLTSDSLDTILALLIEINIKKYPITDTNTADFCKLHSTMTSLCSSLIKLRHILLTDRIPQFLHIFKDLLHAIVLYKSDRQKDTALNPVELNEIAELALKLEVLMHAIASHKTDVKRVAPFALIYAINLMVSGKRPTTLYPKVKTHIEAICYSLIGICDHRVGRFILRCSNEAARQTYELLVKDHQKYHKFKGKV